MLRGVDLAVRAGEAVAILGPNGAGKTTLTASLAGLLRLKSGRRHGALGGVAFQNPETQFIGGSVIEEIRQSLNGKHIRTKDRNAAADAAQQILARWGLSALSAAHPYELSQGQKRRLALASLTATDRWPLLVLDEPTAGLDPNQIREVRELIRQLAERHTLLLSTHILPEAEMACRRILIIDKGRIVASDSTESLQKRLLGDALIAADIQGDPDEIKAELLNLNPVDGVEHDPLEEGWGRYLSDSATPDVRSRIFDCAASKGWKLRELHLESRSLEDIFVAITRGNAETEVK
ncbi:MAG: ABC transporter ATP-binding protein [Oricola sp.]|nr:ABC transporter ATP-binding protein [Oricola sp.]